MFHHSLCLRQPLYAPLAILFFYCTGSLPVHAQSWVEDTSSEVGTGTGATSESGAAVQPFSDSWSSWDPLYDCYIGFYFGPDGYTNATASTGWDQTFVFRWENSDGSAAANPPSRAYFLENGSATGSFAVDTDYQTWYPANAIANALNGIQSVSADDGLGDKSVMNYVLNSENSVGHQAAVSAGKHLVQRDGSSGVVTLDISGSASAAANYIAQDPYPYIRDWLEVGIDYLLVTPDVRGLTISTDSGANAKSTATNPDGSNQTDAYGNIVYIPGPQPKNSDGTCNADIGIANGSPGYENFEDVTYRGVRVGGWSLNYDTDNWYSSMTGHSLSDTVTPSSPNISPFTVTYMGPDDVSGAAGSVGTDHIHLTYTDDSDGAVAHANFYMKIHRALEFNAAKGPNNTFIKHPDLSIESPGYAIENGSIGCTWDQYSALIANDITAAEAAFAAASAFQGGWVGALLAAAGVGVGAFTPSHEGSSAVFDDCWNDTRSVKDSPPAGYSQIPGFYHMTPMYNVEYQTYAYAGDQWDMTGYTGQTFKSVAKPDGNEYFTGHFTWNGPQPN